MVTRRRSTLSKTSTRPARTRISVLVARSSVSQIVPRTVAAAYRAFVVKRPLPFPQSLRTLGVGGGADDFRFGHVERARRASAS